MSLRHTLLGLLDWTPLHGYALREMARGFAWLHPMSNANIYPTLRELEDEGFVHHEEQVRDGRLRKVYAVTDAGRRELRRWLSDPTTPRGVYRDPVLLKVSLLRDGSYGPAAAWLESEIHDCDEVVESTRRFLADPGSPLPRYTRRVVEHGLELARVRGSWLREVRDALAEESDDAPADGAPAEERLHSDGSR